MAVLVTGAAGFIGYHVAEALLQRGETVVGVDNLNDYYPVALKQARLDRLRAYDAFRFHVVELSEPGMLEAALEGEGVNRVIHLAAQAGVRKSLSDPFAYVRSNLIGHMSVLEYCRHHGIAHLVYASSSSVYGGSKDIPYAEEQRADRPVSLYAATKRADELLSHSYAELYDIKQIGLRFFTVYGPWGRPDMAYWIFADAILQGRPIQVFNHGNMRRDFTFIDDVVPAVLSALDRRPFIEGAAPHRIFNLGNHRPEPLGNLIQFTEEALGMKAEIEYLPMQPGDVEETFASIDAARKELDFTPRTALEDGVRAFVAWFHEWRGRQRAAGE